MTIHHQGGLVGMMLSIMLSVVSYLTLSTAVAFGAIFASLCTGTYYLILTIRLLKKKK